MTDEDQIKIDRSTRAQALIDDEMLKEAFDSFDAGCIQLWRATAVEDVDGRENLWLMAHVAGKIRGNLQAILDDGNAAAAQIAEIGKRRPSEALTMSQAYAQQDLMAIDLPRAK